MPILMLVSGFERFPRKKTPLIAVPLCIVGLLPRSGYFASMPLKV